MKFLVLLTLAGFGLASPRFFPFEKTQNIYAHDGNPRQIIHCTTREKDLIRTSCLPDESSQQQIMKVLSSVPSSVKKINLKIFFGTESKCVKKGGCEISHIHLTTIS
jgi:hypothetical protein